jgi:hypothetical protein
VPFTIQRRKKVIEAPILREREHLPEGRAQHFDLSLSEQPDGDDRFALHFLTIPLVIPFGFAFSTGQAPVVSNRCGDPHMHGVSGA